MNIDKAYDQAEATAEFEGFIFTEEDEKVIKGVVSGKITRN